eukprot:9295793-Ditylum_brightwellii.AAC.2
MLQQVKEGHMVALPWLLAKHIQGIALTPQGSAEDRALAHQHLFRTINKVFWPNDEADTSWKENISAKILKQGDACWVTKQKLFGWVLDTLCLYLYLPAARLQKVVTTLLQFPRSHRCTKQMDWESLCGQLRNLATVLPGGYC